MPNPIANITNKIDLNRKLNVICYSAHERFEPSLAMTGHNFYALSGEHVKPWNTKYSPIPENYNILKNNRLPLHLDFDLIITHNPYVHLPIAQKLYAQLALPILNIMHTLPVPGWGRNEFLQHKQLFNIADKHVFISEFNRDVWGFDNKEKVIHHGIDTNFFKPDHNKIRKPHILTVANDYANRDWCKPAGQKILTSLGYINIENIKIGDLVLTDSGYYHRVKDTQVRNYFGPMVWINIDGYKQKIGFTSTHNIRVFRNNQYQYIDAIRLKIGDILKFPKIQQTEFYETSEDLSYLIGNIIGDGNITNKGCIQICCNIQELEKAKKLQKILEDLTGNKATITERYREKQNIYRIDCSSKVFACWLKNKLGNKSYEKYIPNFIFNSSDNVRLSVLKGLWSCDGSFKDGKTNNRFKYSTISIRLASQISAILHNFGVQCYIRKEKRKTNKSNGQVKWIYRVTSANYDNVEKCKNLINNSITNEPYHYIVKNVEIEEEWHGNVYNCTVDEDPSYIVYPGFVAHNCLGFRLYQAITQNLPKRPIGDTAGLSKPANNMIELLNEYQTSRVFLNTSLHSPIPMSVIEAMACGCAVVSTNTAMLPDIIEHGVDGFLYSPNKPEKAITYIKDLLENEDKALTIGVKAREKVERMFSLERFIKEYNEVIYDVVRDFRPYSR